MSTKSFHKMEKGIGNVTTCNNCDTKVECKLDSKDKLSWYNFGTDTKHYNFVSEGNFECNTAKTEDDSQTTLEQKVESTEIPKQRTSAPLDDITAEFVDKQNIIIDGIEEKVAVHLAKKYPEQIIDGARIGLRSKMIWYKLIGL